MITLKAMVPQLFSDKEREQKISVELETVISYGINGAGNKFVEIKEPTWQESEVFIIDDASYVFLLEMMEDYYNPNKFGKKME